jgi:hypothetical protein
VDIHRSARRHGIGDQDIRHAADHPLVVVDLDAEADPPKLLVVGPDRAGNMIEVIILTLADDRLLAVHAMALREKYYALLPRAEDQ